MQPRPYRSRQSGAALIVGLVLLMVLTVLAISTMRTATLETAMAGNAQYRQKAFQIAEAGVADIMGSIVDETFDFTVMPQTIGPVPVVEQDSGEEIGNYTVTVSFIGISLSPGYSLPTVDENYQILSTGRSSRNALSVQTQGFKRRVAEPPF